MIFFQTYPKELQSRGDHFENPLAPYETIITYNDLSETARKIMKYNGIHSTHYSQKKLIADFNDRIEYTTHVENLKYYISKVGTIFVGCSLPPKSIS